MGGYGENTWYDTLDHAALHTDLRADPAATMDIVRRRPVLMSSVERCPVCADLRGADRSAAAPAALTPRQLSITLGLPELARLLHAYGIDAAHRPVYAYVEQGQYVTVVVECPPDEPAHSTGPAELAATPAA